jgi:ACS family glucarate transporter-like MFS transporter
MIPRRSFVVLATFLLSVLLYVDRVCISTAKEAVVGDLALTDRQWGVVMSAFAFGYALLQTPTGALADRMGARSILASVVTLWSLFTGLTAAAWNFASLVAIRFLFGAGEAGAFPGVARVVYSWFPVGERGLVKGINFSGARLGAAATMPILPWMIERLGWKESFLLLMLIGFAWSIGWWLWFRDDPAEQKGLPRAELDYILATRQKSDTAIVAAPLNLAAMFRSGNLWLAMGQYFASNFTFFFTLTWLYPYVKNRFQLESVSAGLYAMVPLIAGALGNIIAGWWVDALYRRGWHTLSRRLPAIVGFSLAALGLVFSVGQDDPLPAVAWLSLAIFGADMTLAPSWSFCIDIGGRHAGAVSGTMNMAGNLGSAVVGLVFPVLVENYGERGFFFAGAALNLIAIVLWLGMIPGRRIRFES